MIEQTYIEGKIVTYMWGYEQTNIDFFKIIKRKGDFATLQPLKSKILRDEDMRGEVIPSDEIDTDEPIIRRKVHVRDGKESGIAVKSYGWASLWEGQPEHFTSYA
jgi:hypothetical protein